MKSRINTLLAALMMLLITHPVIAQTPVAPDESARLMKVLQTRLPPTLVIQKVQPSPWPWLYEVITNSEMFYVDTSGDYLFYGHIMDTKTRADLTAKRWNDLTRIDFNNDLPLSLAIKHVKGDGSRKIAVFADPFCPFCARLENALQSMTNITVYTFLYPLESLHPGATETAKNIWCSPNRAQAWSDWILRKKKPVAINCKADEVNELVKLGEKMNINGTPTIYFTDGHHIASALTKEQLEEELKSVK